MNDTAPAHRFDGRSVVVTGVGRAGQVGEAVAREFAQRGSGCCHHRSGRRAALRHWPRRCARNGSPWTRTLATSPTPPPPPACSRESPGASGGAHPRAGERRRRLRIERARRRERSRRSSSGSSRSTSDPPTARRARAFPSCERPAALSCSWPRPPFFPAGRSLGMAGYAASKAGVRRADARGRAGGARERHPRKRARADRDPHRTRISTRWATNFAYVERESVAASHRLPLLGRGGQHHRPGHRTRLSAPRRRQPSRIVMLDRSLEALPLFRLSDSADDSAIDFTADVGGRWRVLPAPGERLPGTFDQDVYVELCGAFTRRVPPPTARCRSRCTRSCGPWGGALTAARTSNCARR